MAQLNALDRRRDKLADALQDRMDKVTKYITEPRPYNKQKVKEEDQVRQYLDLRESGGLIEMRSRMGDESVDSYVKSMEPRVYKYMGLLAEREEDNAKINKETEEVRESGEPVATFYTADDDLESF